MSNRHLSLKLKEGMNMKIVKLVLVAVIGASLLGAAGGCTSMRNMAVKDMLKDTKEGQDTDKLKAFENKLTQTLDDVKAKDDYKKIPLKSTEDSKWFIEQAFILWDKQQTKEQYIKNGDERFPGYSKSFGYLADEFSK
jgi:hypothetical protein